MSLHPQAKAYLDDLAARNMPGWDEFSAKDARDVFAFGREIFGDKISLERVEDKIVRGIPVRVYSPRTDVRLPGAMYFHGGGWVLGDLDTHDCLCRELALRADCTVVAVDYRRAPESTYPAAFDDCFLGTSEVFRRADEFGIAHNSLAVVGDSAGGNLAAAVTLKAREQGGPNISLQVLIYPVIEPRLQSDSSLELAERYGLTRHIMQWFWRQYLGTDDTICDHYAAPGYADNLRELPTAHIVTAEYDILRDEGEAYAKRLQLAGVTTTVKRYDGALHGFVHLSGAFDDGKQARIDISEVIKQHFAD